MSERTDKKNELLKSNIQDSTELYDTQQDINNGNDILKYLLNKSVIYNSQIISNTTDWNALEDNSAYLVNSYAGKNAPSAAKFTEPTGLVFVVGGYQVALSDHELAFRNSNSAWSYLDLPDNGVPKSVKDYISNQVVPQIEANRRQVNSLATDAAQDHASLAADATSLSNELGSIDVNSDDISNAESFIKKNGASIDNVNKFAQSNKGTIDSLAGVDSSLSSAIGSASTSLNSAKADKTSVNNDVSTFNQNLNSLSTSAKNASAAQQGATTSLSTSTSSAIQATNNHFHGLTFGDIKPTK